MTSSPAKPAAATGRRPLRSASFPPGYRTTNSAATATANTAPTPNGDIPSPSLPNSGTSVS